MFTEIAFNRVRAVLGNGTAMEQYVQHGLDGMLMQNSNLISTRKTNMTMNIYELKNLAQAGNVDAMYNLGLSLCEGRDGIVSRQEGAAWLEEAARRGDVEAMFAAGGAFSGLLGGGPAIDWSKAAEWTIKAAEHHYPKAFRPAAVCYEDGIGGTPINKTRAIAYYRLAAIHGDEYAKTRVG